MKKMFFCLNGCFFIFIIFSFLLNRNVFAQHACNQSCTGAGTISCSQTTGSLSFNRGSCNAGLACYNAVGNRCRNPYCPNDTDCTCSNFTIQGYKKSTITPFPNQLVILDGVYPHTGNPYFFTNVPANAVHRVNASVPAGFSVGYTLCYDSTNCHTNPPTPGSQVYICSNNSPNINLSYADLWWHYTPLTPNVKNLLCPSGILAGDPFTCSASYENGSGQLTAAGMDIYQSRCGDYPNPPITPYPNQNVSSPGIYNFNFNGLNSGTYTIYGRAWNNAVAECRGRCVDGPPRYQCAGSDGNGQGSYTTITIQNPSPWYKLKDASLNKIGDHNISVVQNVKKFTDSDLDDSGFRYVIIDNNPGVLISTGNYNPGPGYNPIPASNKNWYRSNYGNINTSLFDNFYQYLISKKLITKITALSDITKSGAYYLQSNNLVLDSQPPNFNFVLIVRNRDNNDYGDVNISINNFNNAGASIFIIAKNITIASGIQNINGIFAATNNFVYNNTDGLKIKGNLISKNAVILQNRPDNSRPSLFIVFSPKMYLDLLPYLSIAKYEWKQLQ